MRRTIRLLWATIGVVGLTATTLATWPVRASDPPSHSLVVPDTPGQTVQVTWTGTIPPGTNPTSDCNGGAAPTHHHNHPIQGPAGPYPGLTAKVPVAIPREPS